MLPAHKGKPLAVIMQSRQASYERTRVKIADDIRTLMKEQGLTDYNMAAALRVSVNEARVWINSRDLTLNELTKVLDCLGVDFYPILRPRKNGSYD